MNEQIIIGPLRATRDRLEKTADVYFDLRQVKDGATVRRLVANSFPKDVDNVSATWQYTVYRPDLTETEVLPSRYFGDRIVFFWSRPITEPVAREDLEEEANKALEAAVQAAVAAGYEIMPHPRKR